MGKVRVKSFGNEEEERQQAEEAKARVEAKKEKQRADAGVQEETTLAPTEEKEEKKAVKKTTPSTKKSKGKKYLEKAEKVETAKLYKLTEALTLLPEVTYTSFDGTVELHINTNETGVSGAMTLPHGTGKQMRVAIATEEIIAEIEGGNINFDILLSEPMMMAKLAKVAKILGPRGLMPNPKNGTVHPNPTEAAKKFEAGQMNYKTEAKFPLLHLTVGKVSFGNEKLADNIKFAVSSVQKKNIKSLTLKSTMSPGIKLDMSSL